MLWNITGSLGLAEVKTQSIYQSSRQDLQSLHRSCDDLCQTLLLLFRLCVQPLPAAPFRDRQPFCPRSFCFCLLLDQISLQVHPCSVNPCSVNPCSINSCSSTSLMLCDEPVGFRLSLHSVPTHQSKSQVLFP